jgi:iron complex transport system substrate-binding protein
MKNKIILNIIQFVFFSLMSFTAQAGLQATDDWNRLITLKHPATRIITLSPNATELLFDMQLGNLIVGTIKQSDYPKETLKISCVGNYIYLDEEKILSLHPDLIIAPLSSGVWSLIQQFESFGIPVYIFDPHQILDIFRNMNHLGQLTHQDKLAQRAEQYFRKKWEDLKNCQTQFLTHKPSVFYSLWNYPIMTVAGHNLINEVIETCGGKNIFSSLKISYPIVDLESVLAAHPDVIIVPDSQQYRFWQHYISLLNWKNTSLIMISSDDLQRYSTRIFQGAQNLCNFYNKLSHSSL